MCRLSLCVLLLACGEDVQWVDARIEIQRPTASACRLDAQAAITVRALGDFAPSGTTVEQFDPRQGTFSIERFPLNTQLLRFEVGNPEPTAGAALTLRVSSQTQSALLLPLERSCPSPDFEARALPGAAITPLPDGALLIAGGRNDDEGADGAATSTAFVLPAGRELVDQVEGGMFLRRSGASATVLGDHVVVIGGGAHDRGPAHETYERFDLATRRFAASAGAVLVHGPRRDHAAVALADERGVLVVGGVSELGEVPLASVELVTSARAVALGELALARTQPALHRLSDGRVLIVGGLDDNANPVGAIEAFDPNTDAVTSLSVAFPLGLRAASALLVGDRVAWIACGVSACDVSVLITSEAEFRVVENVATLPLLSRLHAVGLADGTLLVVGQRRVSDLAQAWRVDLGAGVVSERGASRVASALHPLADGVIAELDATGLSLRRDPLTTPFDNPGATLLAGDRELALDLAQHWTRAAGGLIARRDGARLDLAGLVFGAFRLTLDVTTVGTGEVALRLQGDSQITTVAITDTAVHIGPCRVARANPDASITLERHDDRIRLITDDAMTTCTSVLPEHVALSVIASAAARVGPISLQRL